MTDIFGLGIVFIREWGAWLCAFLPLAFGLWVVERSTDYFESEVL